MTLRPACLLLLPFLALAQSPELVRRSLEDWRPVEAVSAARALAAAVRGPSLEHGEALDLLGEALSLAGEPDALRTLDQAFQEKSATLPPGDLTFARTHLARGAERGLRREWRPAIEEYRKALAILNGRPGDPAEDLRPQVMLAIGTAATTLGQNKDARTALDEALAAAEKRFGASHPITRSILRALSTLAYQESNLAAAEQFLQRANPGPAAHPVEEVQHLLLSAGLALERGRYDEASAGLRRALSFHEERLGPTNRRLLPVLRNISRCHRFLAEFQSSIRASERGLAISVAAFGEQSPATSEILGVLASAKAESGVLAEARQLYDRALAIQIQALGPSHSVVGFELFSLANLEQVMGDFQSSLTHAGRALAIREAVDGKESARTVTIYALLGRVNAMNGDLAKGRQLAELAVAIGRRTVGDAHPRTIFALSDLGEVLYLSKDFATARRHFADSLAGQTKLFGENSIRTAQGQYNLGLAERALGNHAAAFDRFSRAGRIWRQAFGPDYLFLAETNAGEAASLLALGRPAEALGPALEAARVRRTTLSAVAMTAAEREALLFARVDRDGLLLALDLAASGQLSPPAVTQVWDAVIRDRAAVLDAMARRRRSAQSGGQAAALFEQISRLKKELAQTALVGDPKLYASRVTSIRQELDAAERQLARQSDFLTREAAGTRAGWTDVSAAIPAGAALLGYARGESQYVAFLARPGAANPVAVPLGPIARLDPLVAAWHAELERERNSAGRNARRNEAAYRQAGLALRRAIWDPLLPHIADSRSVFAAPDGALQLVNLDTLPTGTSQYLAETGPRFHLLSSERDLIGSQPAPAAANRSLLALGNPAFGTLTLPAAVRGEGACTELDRSRFQPLPGSGAEAQSIARLWTARGGRSQILNGSQASESALKSLAAGHQVLHLATHGFFLDSACRRGRDSLLDSNPLLRSGLVLAAGGAGQDDGLLTAEEVSTLHLENTELVVLSGCDTARGANEAGEGLLGLRRAFQAAGARQIVSSLWPIDDTAARAWMLRFYQARLERNSSVAESVRAASVSELRRRRAAAQSTHPFYWGSFVASGF